MVVNFLDDKFPKEIKYKMFQVEEDILKNMKVKSYNFIYDTLYNNIKIKLNFDIKTIELYYAYDEIKINEHVRIYYNIANRVNKEILDNIYKEV